MSGDWVGQTVGSYRFECEIGAGGCGRVYRALDQMLDRPVAIKVLDTRIAAQEGAAERFRAEAHTLARLSHPNVAALYSLLVEGDAYLMVMEYVEGLTLDALVQRRGRLALNEILPIFFQVLDGVEHVHGFGVIHRDLKAANVMLRPDGVAKVLDFGIASALSTGPDGLLQGSPDYMAPEQLRGEEVDERTDLYALGVLLYRALCGEHPFSGQDPMSGGAPERRSAPRLSLPGLPEVVADVIEQVLSPDPELRFANAAELRRVLDRRGEGFAVGGLLAPATSRMAPPDRMAPADRNTVVIDSSPETEAGPPRVDGVTGALISALAADAERAAAAEALDVAQRPPAAGPPVALPRGERSHNKWRRLPVLAIAALLLALGAGWISLERDDTPAARSPPPVLEPLPVELFSVEPLSVEPPVAGLPENAAAEPSPTGASESASGLEPQIQPEPDAGPDAEPELQPPPAPQARRAKADQSPRQPSRAPKRSRPPPVARAPRAPAKEPRAPAAESEAPAPAAPEAPSGWTIRR